MGTREKTAAELGLISRRTALKSGLGVAATAALLPARAAAQAGPRATEHAGPAAITGAEVSDLTGPGQTGQFGAPLTDLGIPALCPDGTMLFVCGDTFDGAAPGQGNWVAPALLRSSSASLGSLKIDSCVGGSHVVSPVNEPHNPVGNGHTTAIPSDVFTIGNTMYMHLMRGEIYNTDHTDFWQSTDSGQTWQYLCQWPADQYGGQFQQKTYAVGNDGYCYVLSTVFNRGITSGLLLHRVEQNALGTPSAYQPWGYANGAWAWGNQPTTISAARQWGEICFRAIGGKYAFTWLNNPSQQPGNTINAQVLDQPTSDFTAAPEQVMITGTNGADSGTAVNSPYGGFIIPGSTFADFHICVSQWIANTSTYHVMHYVINGLAA